MKNFNLSKDEMLNREQLQNVFGGIEEAIIADGSCTATLTCNTGSISCSSDSGDCERGWGDITCDGQTYEC